MKKKFLFILVAMTLNLAVYAMTADIKNYDTCFMLYSINDNKIVHEYNPDDRCHQRIAADSTFKIPLSLMAFDQSIINQNTVFKWDGQQRALADWNQDQTPKSWLKDSVVWVSQKLTVQLGLARIKKYLANFNYGNQDFSGGLTHAWLSSSLKISAVEQLNFLNAMLNNQLAVSREAIANTKKNLYQGKLNNGADYYGKTGAGRQGKLREGWFVGFVENGTERYIFVSNLTDKVAPPATDKSYGSKIMKPITLELLNDYFQ